ncbi:MAG TPA: LEA type 2 family protein [Desulfuromonadales bacterium]|nr:LEA type 2 family protein [Desulfuromonadales bacterium]
MPGLIRFAIALVMFSAISGCAGLDGDFETPTVGVSSFRILPSEGVVPRFEIGLHIVNPNRTPLRLDGIVYSVILEGHKILTGVSGDLPVIAGYGEGDITLTATPDLLSSASLLSSLMNRPRQTFAYELHARLDIGQLRPRINVREQGEVSLAGTGR